jgi:cell division protein FtsB
MDKKDIVSIWNRIEENKKIVPYIMNTCMVIMLLLLIYNFYTGRLTIQVILQTISEDFGWLKFW